MGKKVSYTCDHPENAEISSVCGSNARYIITTEIQNVNTVFNVHTRYSCELPSHVGYLVTELPSIVHLVQEAMGKDTDPKRVYPVDKWFIRGTNVRTVEDDE